MIIRPNEPPPQKHQRRGDCDGDCDADCNGDCGGDSNGGIWSGSGRRCGGGAAIPGGGAVDEKWIEYQNQKKKI